MKLFATTRRRKRKKGKQANDTFRVTLAFSAVEVSKVADKQQQGKSFVWVCARAHVCSEKSKETKKL